MVTSRWPLLSGVFHFQQSCTLTESWCRIQHLESAVANWSANNRVRRISQHFESNVHWRQLAFSCMLKGSPKASTHKWGVFFVHPSREVDCPRNLGQKPIPSEMGWCTWLNKALLWRLTEKDPMSVNFFVKIMRFPVSLGVLWGLCFLNFSFRAPHGKTTKTIQVQQDAAETSAKTRSSKHRCISPHRLRRFRASSDGPETGSPLMFPQTSQLGVNVEQVFRLPKKVPKSQHSTSLRGLGKIHGNEMHVVFCFGFGWC